MIYIFNTFMNKKFLVCALSVAMLSLASCSEENNTTKPNASAELKDLTTFSSVSEKKEALTARKSVSSKGRSLLTSMDHLVGQGGTFFWEPGDNLYVYDGSKHVKNFQNTISTSKQPRADFYFNGSYTNASYNVYYKGTGNQEESNQVTIAVTQTQATPNTTTHFGAAGDCGMAKADRQGDGTYTFDLKHKAAYLCFLPKSITPQLNGLAITKIVVTSMDGSALAGTYQLPATESGQLSNAESTSTEITLTTGTTTPFILSANQNLAANGAYMVIAPGTHRLAIEYYLTEEGNNSSSDEDTRYKYRITKMLASNNFEENKVYDVTSTLSVDTKVKTTDYYMWDATAPYWNMDPNALTNPAYLLGEEEPLYSDTKYGSASPAGRTRRFPEIPSELGWYNETAPATSPVSGQYSAKDAPNANEMLHYIFNGDYHWDGKAPFLLNDRLYRGGGWLLTEAAASAKATPYSKTSSPTQSGGNNYTTELILPYSSAIPLAKRRTETDEEHKVAPKVKQRKNYFFLPASGGYRYGQLYKFQRRGYYWANTAPRRNIDGTFYDNLVSYYINFSKDDIRLDWVDRNHAAPYFIGK